MSDFHEIALQSLLFKGRNDWYFCYLKAEKIAHVLYVLSASGNGELKETARSGSEIPKAIAYFAAGEFTEAALLADIFSIISTLRLEATKGRIHKENARILVEEYESIVRKIASGAHLSPFVSRKDLEVPLLPQKNMELGSMFVEFSEEKGGLSLKDINKGQRVFKDTKKDILSRDQKDRSLLILDFVKKNKGVSIKDISTVVKDCSEKTIQRELVSLIEQGLVEKVGERRWSLYFSREEGAK